MNNAWNKNISPVGWYLATELLRFIPDGVDAEDPHWHFLVWENLRLVQANDPENAYEKAVIHGERNNSQDTEGRWQFEGLTDLLPIYGGMTDGSEIMWTEHEFQNADVRQRVKRKEQLQVFSND